MATLSILFKGLLWPVRQYSFICYQVLDGICAYLNRSFKKQAQEANSSFYEIRTDNVFEIYNLALYEWKIIFFGEKNKPDNINLDISTILSFHF